MKTNLEILEANYWEHFKMAKDMSLYLPVNNPKRKEIEKVMNEMITKINNSKKQNANRV